MCETRNPKPQSTPMMINEVATRKRSPNKNEALARRSRFDEGLCVDRFMKRRSYSTTRKNAQGGRWNVVRTGRIAGHSTGQGLTNGDFQAPRHLRVDLESAK